MTTSSVDVILVVGKDKIPVRVSRPQPGIDNDCLSIHHLCLTIQQHTNIIPQAQKIIYRGRTLFKTFDPEDPNLKKSLSSLGIKNGDRIMVFGKPSVNEKKTDESDPRLDELMKVLDQHQVKIDEICVMCRDMMNKVGKDPGKIDDLKKHRKFFLGQSELSMQELTRLDATPGDLSQHPDYKARRKALVNRLLENISLCDKHVERLDSSIQKMEGGRRS